MTLIHCWMLLKKVLEKIKPHTKAKIILKTIMEEVNLATDESTIEKKRFQSQTEIRLNSTNLDELWSMFCEQMLKDLAKFQMNGSGWSFHSINALDIHLANSIPLNGSPYTPLTKSIAEKKRV